MGAHDDLTKPFGIDEFRAGCVPCCGMRPSWSPRGSFTAVRLNTGPRLARDGDEVPAPVLTSREVGLHEALVLNCGHAVAKESLLNQMSGLGGDVGPHCVQVHVQSLRRKLDGGGVVLGTAHGRAYLPCDKMPAREMLLSLATNVPLSVLSQYQGGKH